MPDKAISRREFAARSAISAATLAAGACAAEAVMAGQDSAAPAASPHEHKHKQKRPAVKIGFHTDAFNSAFFNFEKCLQWAQEHHLHFIECGVMDGSPGPNKYGPSPKAPARPKGPAVLGG